MVGISLRKVGFSLYPSHLIYFRLSVICFSSDLCTPDRVFLLGHAPVTNIREAFEKAHEAGGILHFRLHDFRHTDMTNMRGAGFDHVPIMKITGHNTYGMFYSRQQLS